MRSLTLIIVLAAAAAVSASSAQTLSDWQKGRLLARQVCAECHAVERYQIRSRNAQAPSFTAVAATPGMTAAALNAFLHTSHRAMPNLVLTQEETRGVTAYILSLKR
jgi:mono/diheme cytochrome c family protein